MAIDADDWKGWHLCYERDGDPPDAAGEGGGFYDRDYFTGAIIRFEPLYGAEGQIVDLREEIVCEMVESPREARLIAAAPDLEEALRAMLRVHGNCGSPAAQEAADKAARALARLEPGPLDDDDGLYRR